jgi:hypothetical protein
VAGADTEGVAEGASLPQGTLTRAIIEGMSEPTLSELMNQATHAMSPDLLRGWSAISKFTGKSPVQLRRYVRYGFPCARWGKNTYSEKTAIVLWLFQREQVRRALKRRSAR